jgi:two-component system response regulator AtoC
MQRLYAGVQRASSHRYPVLIVGEGGTGKELTAKSIHSQSANRQQPFVSIDCAELAPTLMEAEIFGFARNSFVGTPQAKKGLPPLAESGTLFIREIGEMSVKVQTKLFHALQDQQFSPVGSAERLPLRARLMASSRQDLAALVRKGGLLEDLFFHLSVARLELPPLHARRGDVPLLASHFVENYAEHGQPLPTVSDAAMECLLTYSWPGNVLELERAIRWALSFAAGPVIELDDLPPIVRGAMPGKLRDSAGRLSTLQAEYLAIVKALDASGGNRSAAARILKMPEAVLDTRLQTFGL